MRNMLNRLRLGIVASAIVLASCGGGSGGTSTPAPTAPPTPAGVIASATSPTSVTVTWSASAGAASYTVLRDGSTVGSSTSTSYTDDSVAPSTTYHYAVSAVGSSGLTSAASTTVDATTPAAIPAAPTGLQATALGTSSIALTWTPAAGATGYIISRDGVALTSGATTTSASYTDTGLAAGTTYTYSVQSSNATGTSMASAAASATTTVPATAPGTPGSLSISSVSATSLTLTWSASAPGSNGIGGYYVYRNGASTPVATITSATTYSDTGLSPATAYTYQVAAFDKTTPTPLVSALSNTASATTSSGLPVSPATPTGLSALATTNTSVSLTWTAVGPTQTGPVSYRIFRNGGAVAIGTSSTAAYTDATASQATTYSYTVQAYDSAAHSSSQSAPATLTTPGPTTPAGLTATATSNVAIALTWTAATDTLPNVGYRVYRDNTALPASITTNAYTDTVAQASTHSYTVLAIDGAGYQSAQSATAAATSYGPTTPALSVTGTTANSVSLAWTAVTDAYGLGGYRIYRGTSAGSITTPLPTLTAATTSYTDSGLVAGTYYYKVVAFDTATGAGPYSASSGSVSATVTSASPIVIAPRQVALTLQQTQQYAATIGGTAVGGSITWSVDGIAGGSSAVGTITSGGLYTPPATPGNHAISATSGGNASVTSATVAVTDLGGIYTYHADNARTGQNLQEYALTSASVAPANFGKLFSCAVDGDVYAQPVYVANLAIGGGTHNVVFVVTMHDTVYAFDADAAPSCVTYWSVPYANGTSVTSVPALDASCTDDVHTEYGITGTPVVDPAAKVLYFVTKTKESGQYFQRLHALDLATGTEKPNSPATIAATVPNNGGSVTFDPLPQNQRAGLALANGQVYIAWASHCDVNAWHGWMMAYDATALTLTKAFVVTPNGTGANGGAGGIWMSGGAPALDSSSPANLYVTTGNGTFDPTSSVVTPYAPGNDYGESFLKLSSVLGVVDFYTPQNNSFWTAQDLDLSSSGVTLLPDNAGSIAHPNLLVGSDKQGHLWALDRSGQPGASTSAMGGFNSAGDNVVSYQTLPINAATVCGGGGLTMQGTMTYWNRTLYAATTGGPLYAIALSSITAVPGGGATPPTVATVAHTSESYQYPTPTAAISSAPGASAAILWALDNNANGTDNCNGLPGPAILRAYDATTLATLYSSDQQGGRDAAGDSSHPAIKFQPPVVANGHVYVAVSGQLVVYGLLP